MGLLGMRLQIGPWHRTEPELLTGYVAGHKDGMWAVEEGKRVGAIALKGFAAEG